MSNDEPVVVTEKLTKRYGELTAVDNLSFALHRGKILGLIGPNGAGKTTAIKILVGLARPTAGSARIAGADCTRQARKIKRLVGYMPDRFGSYDNMRVREYLDFFGAAFGIGFRKRGKRIDEVLEITGATYMQDRYVESLSHGMQQRIGIARTLLHDPQVLILDEPANGLDPQARVEMRQLLLHLAQMNKTLIVTSHVLPELSRICDLVAILSKGRLKAFGALHEIARQISPERMIEVQLSTAEQVPRATEILQQAMGAAPEGSPEIEPSTAEASVRFRTHLRDAELGDVLAQLVRAGICVTQFRELQTDLEDAFLSVTQDETAPEAETAGAQADTASVTGGVG